MVFILRYLKIKKEHFILIAIQIILIRQKNLEIIQQINFVKKNRYTIIQKNIFKAAKKVFDQLMIFYLGCKLLNGHS